MTDARLPERWLTDPRFLRLSGPAYKLFCTLLLWSVAHRTDGLVEEQDVVLLPGADPVALPELEASGLLLRRRGRLVVADFAETQTSSTQLRARDDARKRDRERKARERAASSEKTTCPSDVHPDVPSSVPPGSPAGRPPGPSRQGQGQAKDEDEDRQGAATRGAKPCSDYAPAGAPDPEDDPWAAPVRPLDTWRRSGGAA